MKHLSLINWLTALPLALSLMCTSGIAADRNNKPTEKTYPAFKYSEAATDPVVEYNLVHDMIAEPDPEPLLRVYGNGRVHVHYPAYMKKAGDYELQLSKPELDALIRDLANDGVIDFDKGKVLGRRKQLEDQRHASTGILHHISDDTTTVIDIRLEEYQRSSSTKRATNVNKRFIWKNLEHDARQFPETSEIQGAAKGSGKIRDLMTHPGIKTKHN